MDAILWVLGLSAGASVVLIVGLAIYCNYYDTETE